MPASETTTATRFDREVADVSRTSGAVASAAVLLGLVVLGGCTVEAMRAYPDLKPEPVYDVLYPHHLEICAVSQIRAKFAKEGGSPGHAVMFLKGVCKDDSAPYPRLKICEATNEELEDPNLGTGVSVNKVLKNVNWLAVPTEDLFYDGHIVPDQVLDEDHAVATILDADRAGVYNGVEIHDQYVPEGQLGLPEEELDFAAWKYLLASETLSTDFALRFGRSALCARMPMSRERLQRVIDYLNALNDEYASGEADYNWSGYADNCAHALHNSLANAGVWKSQAVNTTKFKQLFNLSVPANEFANLAILGNDFPLEDFRRIYSDQTMRRTLLEENWMPTRHGALIKYLGIHRNNELYETRETILFLEGPFRRKSGKVEAMYEDPRFTLVEDNLHYFRERYQKILDDRPRGWDQPARADEYARARKRYYEYIATQLADVDAKLAQLAAFRASNPASDSPREQDTGPAARSAVPSGRMASAR